MKRVTLEEVARVAGVSRATASRVVNGAGTVDETLRHAVQRAISSTGYLPNIAARSLVTRRADAIGLVLPDEHRMLGDPHLASVVSGVTRVVRPRGIHLVLMMTGPGTREQALSDLRCGRLDGVVLVHTDPADPVPGQLIRSGLPVVLAGRPWQPMPITYVDVDQKAGGALAGERLLRRGCRRVATITGPQDTPAGQDRLRGFLGVAPDAVVAHGDFTRQSGTAAMEELLSRCPDVDGVFVASDLMASGAIPVLHRSGRKVPDDVAVVGFDDSSAALTCEPELTTVRQPIADMAQEMARQLLRQITDPGTPVTSVVFDPSLVVRSSG
ncbi:LacI family DNA-binding transcriptional regulator [Nocardia sp. NRRL S-836]|uniref:LacI family DNA-binding transcriptional regulator n=1 Tax=Nocardia sp. NRRL S-836 TaxID=1519492 RepID=UPI0006AFDD85|nr:LacI family DNA-binding transcriptional regulator [Nocardia sp. NRRL S-836]